MVWAILVVGGFLLRLPVNAKKWSAPFLFSGYVIDSDDAITINQTMPRNGALNEANRAQQDEFYTQLSDIENELKHYVAHFKGKTVLCNCDDPRVSNFFHYFAYNFERLGLKRLITTCYKNQDTYLFSESKSERAVYLIYDGDKNGNRIPDAEEIGVYPLEGDGDFRSTECIELLKQADIVVTNPPFSLFREYVAQLIKYDKKFLIIGNQNAISYSDIFSLLKQNKIWIGYKFGDMSFKVPSHYLPRATRYWQDESGQKWRSMGNICWFTNLDIAKRHDELILYKKYTSEEYPKYDNYEAINVGAVSEIPVDYQFEMGVPITFLGKYCPEQFEIIGRMTTTTIDAENFGYPIVNGKRIYARIIIKRKQL